MSNQQKSAQTLDLEQMMKDMFRESNYAEPNTESMTDDEEPAEEVIHRVSSKDSTSRVDPVRARLEKAAVSQIGLIQNESEESEESQPEESLQVKIETAKTEARKTDVARRAFLSGKEVAECKLAGETTPPIKQKAKRHQPASKSVTMFGFGFNLVKPE